jgi:tRNA (mo5U34)-methyltransferase
MLAGVLAGSTSDTSLGPQELRAAVDRLRWFHTLDLGHGIVTPGEDASPAKLAKLRLPDRLDGLSVLDIGAWDGFFSFAAERRGARRVVAIDPACWNPPAWGERGWGTKQPFELAHRALGSEVQTRDVELLDLSPQTVGEFDVVFFLGVFYHLPDPLPYRRAAASVCRKLLVFESHADLLDTRRPAMAFYPGSEIDGDPSNWWGPNAGAVKGMFEREGFARVETFTEPRSRRVARSLSRRLRGDRYPAQAGRIVAHAWR